MCAKIRFLAFVIICLLFFSCDNQLKKRETHVHYGDEDLILKRTYYEKNRGGGVKSERTFLETGDSLVGHGFGKLYYENGRLEYFANYYRGVKIGSGWEYYVSRNIKEYSFYNPEGHLIYRVHFDENGNIVKEEGLGQRLPQVIIKDMPNNRVSLKIYSASLSKHYKKMYLINPSGMPVDSVLNSQRPFDVFKIPIDTGYFKVKVDYYQYDLVASDSIRFKLE